MYKCPKTCHNCSQGKYCEKCDKINYFLKNSLLSDKQQVPVKLSPDADGTDLEEFKRLQKIMLNAYTFVNQGENLYLWSNKVGNGKSSWAIKIMLSYFLQSWRGSFTIRGLFISMPKYLLELKKAISEPNEYIVHINKYIRTADLVIWDDVSAYTKNSDFELNNILSILDDRLNAGRSNIYTSNLSPEELNRALGSRLASRMVNKSIEIQLEGQDKRGLREGGTN